MFEVGATVGDYQIIGSLGGGGMGEVFQVQHCVTRRVEAMKRLAPRRDASPEDEQRFLREIQLQAGLSHPNIVSVHNAFRAGDELVMVMEWIEGESLQQKLEREPVPLDRALDYTAQALAALTYAHSHGIVHRDISPANLFVTPAGLVKLSDFGLARSAMDLRLTQTGRVAGSLPYMSPEQVRGSASLDERTDVYSMGVLLYELVTGNRPFDKESAYEMMVAHVQDEPAAPSSRRPELPKAIDEIILKALAKEPDQRFQSAAEFRQALERLGAAPAAVRAGTPPRSRLLWGVAGVAAALVLALLAAWWRFAAAPALPPAPAAVKAPEVKPSPMPGPASTAAKARTVAAKPPAAKPSPPSSPGPDAARPAAQSESAQRDLPPKRRMWLLRALGRVSAPFRRKTPAKKADEESVGTPPSPD